MALPAMFRMMAAVASVQAALGMPSPEEVEKLICKVASFQQLEDRATGKVCAIIEETFPKVQFEPDCQTVLEAAWDYAKAQCPQGRGAAPSPEDIEELICKFASKKDVEDRATHAVCSLIQEKFPDIQLEGKCEEAVEAAWDKAVAMCPQGRETNPSPEDIEKMICQYASIKDIEDRATHAVCVMIQDKFPAITFEKRCEVALEAVWDKAVAMCPQGRETFVDPEDIEKLICKFASKKIIEERATRAVCTMLHAKIPDIDMEACEGAVEAAWDKAAAMCPEGRETLPSPEEMEKLICEIASKQEVEDRLTAAVCTKIQAEFPNVMFEQDCEAAVEALWDQAVAKCPQGQGAFPIPEDIVKKLACKVVSQQQIEDKATDLICEQITANFPSMRFDPDCHTALEALWDNMVKAECAAVEAPAVDPEDVERLICELMSKRPVEDRATKLVCTELVALIPNVSITPEECETMLEAAWESMLAQCPKTASVYV